MIDRTTDKNHNDDPALDSDPLTRASQKLAQAREYTGERTPDMAVNSMSGNDDLPEDRVAGAPLGERDAELGTTEQRDALSGVRN